MSKKLVFAALILAMIPLGQAYGVITTYRDNFDTAHNYTTSGVPGFNPSATLGGAIWQGIYNQAAAGADINGGAGSLTFPVSVAGPTNWEASLDTAPLLYRQVNVQHLASVTVHVSSQTNANWVLGGPMVRLPNPIDGTAGQENWMAAWGFTPTGAANFQRNRVLNGGENEGNVNALAGGQADIQYLRIINPALVGGTPYSNVGGAQARRFFTQYSADGINWLPNPADVAGGPNASVNNTSNVNLLTGNVEVGITAWSGSTLVGATSVYDFAEIVIDDTLPAPADTNCVAHGLCTWNVNGSSNFGNPSNWLDNAVGTGTGFTSNTVPSGNTTIAAFGNILAANGTSTVYNNSAITLKELRFNNTNAATKYLLVGAGSITLDANVGDAIIDVDAGNHEIQVDLNLADNVMADAAAGSTLTINAPIRLNGKTFTTSGAGTITLNHAFIQAGSGAGAVSNDGNLVGLAGVEGDLAQSSGGSLGVVVGGSAISVSGAAVLDGTLEVSLADGFTPVSGQSYTVLTADSVTDLGLGLGGSAGSLFRLAVGSNSVTLTAVPEPSTIALFAIGMAAVGFGRRRRRESGRGFFGGFSNMQRVCTFGAVLAVLFAASSAVAQAPPGAFLETRLDNFGTATPHAEQHDYHTDTVPAGGIWTGVHNHANGDGFDEMTSTVIPSFFVADGFGFGGADKAGKLLVEDLSGKLNTSGVYGTGWEAARSSSPFVYTEVPANRDFVAITKIDAMSSGNWASAGILARVKGPLVGVTIGDPDEPLENFVSFGEFVTHGTNTLRKNIVNGAQVADDQAAVTGGVAGNPVYMRMTKIGQQFSVATSLDGITYNAAAAPINNAALNNPANTMEVGLFYTTFYAGATPSAPTIPNAAAEFDFFDLDIHQQLTHETSTWAATTAGPNFGSGNFNTVGNWTAAYVGGTPIAGGAVPNSNTVEAIFGSQITQPATVYTNANVTVKKIRFDNANKYALAGNGIVTLDADVGSAQINVLQGSHEIQNQLVLQDNTAIAVSAGGRLDLDNSFNLNAKTLTVSGAGNVYINSNLDTVNGTVTSTGNIGGGGRINGGLTATAGSVNPGSSAGTLTVEGNYSQTGGTTELNIELGGIAAGTFDRLAATGTASLAGLVDVSLLGGFTPTAGQTWDIVTGTSVSSTAAMAVGDSAYSLSLVAGNTALRLTYNPVGVPGDYNNNGKVDAADYTVYRNRRAGIGGTTLPNDGGAAGVTFADYTFWKGAYGNMGSGASLEGNNVPEPTSIALFVMAMIGVCGVIRRR